MSKAIAYCKCRVCGSEFKRSQDCRNRKEADSWENWASTTYDLCSKCYAKEIQELEKAKGLYVDVRLDSRCIYREDEHPVAIIFGGDTKPHKDEIKSLCSHYIQWTRDYPADGVLKDLLGMKEPPFRWVWWCRIEDFKKNINRVKEMGIAVNSYPNENDLALYNNMKNEVKARNEEKNRIKEEEIKIKEEKKSAELEALGEIPPWPDDIKSLWPKGATWNGKIYGSAGNYNVYFSGENVHITDELKKEMENLHKMRDEWREKKKQIEKKYQ